MSGPEALPGGGRSRLFVIGAARSGTTVLQNALNDSRDIYLLGEPDFHLQGDEPGFAARYNAMHRGWRNHETKSTYCPMLLAQDGPWRDHLDALSRHYRLVGSKIVLNASLTPDLYDRLVELHVREFYDARYVFIFREPRAVVNSTRHLQRYAGGDVAGIGALIANYLRVVTTYTRLVRILPNVCALFHDDMHVADWAAIGDWLGVDCSGAAAYYDAPRGSPYPMDELGERDRHLLDLTTQIAAELRTVASQPLFRAQVEQNEGQLDPAHFTPLGSIHRRALLVMTEAARPV